MSVASLARFRSHLIIFYDSVDSFYKYRSFNLTVEACRPGVLDCDRNPLYAPSVDMKYYGQLKFSKRALHGLLNVMPIR